MISRRAGLDGLLVAGAQIAAGELCAALLPGARSPLTGLGRAMIDGTPGPAVDITVALFEAGDKPLLMANLLGGATGAGVSAVWLRERSPAAARVLVAAQGLAAGGAAAARPDSASAASLASGVAGAAAGVAALDALAARRAAAARASIAGLGLAATAASVRLRGRRSERLLALRSEVALPAPASRLPPPPAGVAVDGLSPLITPNSDFYETDVTFPPPVVDASEWRLRVHGLVERPLELSLRELLALGVEERDSTLVCVHNPVGGPRIGTARWVGVPVARLLAQAGVEPGADQLVARSVDGFSAGVPLALVRDERDAMVAVGMNGEPLPVGHGFPARLLTPGLYGYDANTKWLADLELTTFDRVADYWTRRGWPRDPARVEPSARIDVPRHGHSVAAGTVTVAGVAWAPPTGVTAVEVSVDGGPWQPAELSAELDPAAWRQWRADVSLAAGAHELRVRTAGQDEAGGGSTPPFPRGATGLHAVSVTASAMAAGAPGRAAAARLTAARRVRLAAQGALAWRRHRRGVRG